ncbi:hypothetical protein LOAG_14831, partial [Loa loa]
THTYTHIPTDTYRHQHIHPFIHLLRKKKYTKWVQGGEKFVINFFCHKFKNEQIADIEMSTKRSLACENSCGNIKKKEG